ncbi:MAG: hypothetical protein U1E41_04905 [Paracoccus sp. (in: a-proteobacteria)]
MILTSIVLLSSRDRRNSRAKHLSARTGKPGSPVPPVPWQAAQLSAKKLRAAACPTSAISLLSAARVAKSGLSNRDIRRAREAVIFWIALAIASAP